MTDRPLEMTATPAAARGRRLLLPILAVLAAGYGIAVAVVDSSPGWDDTGITAGALFLGGLVFSAGAGRWPWLWALLVGGWLPALTVTQGGDPTVALAMAFAVAGAVVGGLLTMARRGNG